MASIVTNQGLQDSLNATFGIGTADPIDAMGVSDYGGLISTTTSIATALNKQVNVFDSTPSLSSQTVTCIATFATGEANFTITDITLHNDGAAAYTGVYGGVDSQSLTKTSDFSLTITMKVTYASA